MSHCPMGQTRLVQAGVNGKQELTYRRVLENGVEISKSVVKTVVLQDALPEIMMVGAQILLCSSAGSRQTGLSCGRQCLDH